MVDQREITQGAKVTILYLQPLHLQKVAVEHLQAHLLLRVALEVAVHRVQIAGMVRLELLDKVMLVETLLDHLLLTWVLVAVAQVL